MRSLTSTLIAAITSRVRNPLATLQVDWAGTKTSSSFSSTYDDLSTVLQSVTVDRAITSDLPDEAQVVSGGGAAQITATLGGNMPDGTAVAKALSPYAGLVSRRLASPLLLKLGFRGTAGAEYTNQLVGNVRQVDVDAESRTVSLSGLDARERLDTRVSLPAVTAVDAGNPFRAPNLDAGWVMDYILRANGRYKEPPQTASCLLMATMYGSTYPEAGTLNDTFAWTGSSSNPQGPIQFTTTARGKAASFAANNQIIWGLASPLRLESGWTIFLEIQTLRLTRPASGSMQFFNIGNFDGVNDLGFWITSTGQIRVDVIQAGGGTSLSPASAILPSGTDTYFAAHVGFSGTTMTVNLRIGGTTYNGSVVAGTTTTPVTLAGYFPTGTMTGVTGAFGMTQVCGNLTFSAGLWRDTWAAATDAPVLEASLNPLLGMPAVDDEDAWALLQELAEAEQGVALFDEDGAFRFYNRNHMSGGSSVLTLTPTSHLKALTSSEVVDTVRNVVSVPATQYAAQPAVGTVWTLSEVISLAPLATRVLPVQLPGPAIGARIGVANTGATPAASAFPNSDGTGASMPIGFTYTPTGYSRGYITLDNPSATTTIWAVDASGGPAVFLASARCIVPSENPYVAQASDATSITAYGQQPIDIGDNRWRQTSSAATDLATALLARMKDPHPVLQDVPIIADLRLQLADRVTITEAATLGLSADFWVVRLATTSDTNGMSQTVSVRQV